MELNEIKEILALMEERHVNKLTLKDKEGFELHLEREGKTHGNMPAYAAPLPFAPAAHSAPLAETSSSSPPPPQETEHCITSPMVGTFYGAPSPDDPPYVKVGDSVDEETVVCIVEAMKVMNEVKAGKKGIVKKIFLENGHPVEYDTKLFLLS